MSTVNANPFHKPNPFKYGNYQHFHHPHLPTSTNLNTSYLEHSNSFFTKQSRVNQNNWTFNENNIGKKIDFSKKYKPVADTSDFEVRMRINSTYVPPNSQSKVVQIRSQKLQNPFFRKNLLIDKSEVANQVQTDISLYRHKASSYYEGSGRMSFGSNVPEDSPYNLHKKSSKEEKQVVKPVVEIIKSRYIEDISVSNNQSLGYSKTPRDTIREKEEDQQELGPACIEFRKKKFYFAPVTEQE